MMFLFYGLIQLNPVKRQKVTGFMKMFSKFYGFHPRSYHGNLLLPYLLHGSTMVLSGFYYGLTMVTVQRSYVSVKKAWSLFAERNGARPHQADQHHQNAPHPQQHDLPRAGHRRLRPAQRWWTGLLGL